MESKNDNENNNSLRMVSKLFKCPVCLKGFKKLVSINDDIAKCPECGHEHCTETINSEFNRESVTMGSSYRIPFCDLPKEQKEQYHTVTDTMDKTATNFYMDNRRDTHRQNQNNTQNNNQRQNNNTQNNQNRNNNTQNNTQNNNQPFNFVFIPFNISPFSGSVNRSPYDFNVFNGPIGSDDSVHPSENFFLDNFASNFISNFINPMSRVVFINTMQNQPQGNPPASETAIEKLKHFKMEDKYCKKSDQDPKKLEHPECSICLMEIANGQNTILLPCGHMFHDTCVTKWLKMHNTCPLCRYELQSNNPEYERERNQRNQQRQENINRNPNVHPVNLNNPDMNRLNRTNSNVGNINIQGENAPYS